MDLAGVTEIGFSTFFGCTNLDEIHLNGEVEIFDTRESYTGFADIYETFSDNTTVYIDIEEEPEGRDALVNIWGEKKVVYLSSERTIRKCFYEITCRDLYIKQR